MAEVLLSAVLGKLAQFSFEKVMSRFGVIEAVVNPSLYGIREEVEKLSRELIYIQTFIKDADRKRIGEARKMQWVKDVLDIAYQIEDAIDIFLLECPEKLPGITDLLKGLMKRTTQLSFLYKFREEIKRINCRILEIEEYRKRYGISILGEDINGVQNTQLFLRLSLDYIGDTEVVGFATHRDNIVKCLLDVENSSLAVVSIVGQGGLGKTTLAQKVCNSNGVIQKFGKPIWITISQTYHFLDILREIAQNLDIWSASLNANVLANQICKSLEGRRYLIIFDDVWTEVLWAEISKVLPDMKNMSRVLITTRFANVARRAGSLVPHITHMNFLF
ncbi:Disease resistance protein (CC-NBS-LRR class) family [Rhynchospora pubera]|uniref:Disease resistance protein (CC-NBS-LRR class) family n=1 Tax=Rhynchospora pubera TaxID=906938 RepID=A0AAV8GMI1_9POAL|nr:Disease resistance protein (CC-NBS-LRR class) family [Rhynchospora pubera]